MTEENAIAIWRIEEEWSITMTHLSSSSEPDPSPWIIQLRKGSSLDCLKRLAPLLAFNQENSARMLEIESGDHDDH